MLPLIVIFLTSSCIVLFAIPRIINLANKRNLYDDQKEKRKLHTRKIANLGGVAIFAGILLCQTLFIDPTTIPDNYLIAASVILLMIGLKDDLIDMHPGKKIIGQLLSATIIVYLGDIRFINLDGLLNIYELPYYISIILSIIFIVGVINACNLIDGIDGLAGSQGLIIALCFGFLFYLAESAGWALLCFAISGSMMGFLRYNISPAKIFMGDSGALILGLYVSVLCIAFVNNSLNKIITFGDIQITSGFGIISSLIMIPVFDTIRVFSIRIWDKKSPFKADSNHLHHRLLSIGMTHIQASLSLTFLTLLFFIIALFLQDFGNTPLVILLYTMMFIINILLFFYAEKERFNNQKIDKEKIDQ